MTDKTKTNNHRKPAWFKIKTPLGTNYSEVKNLIDSLGLHTVCQEANCPNRSECYGEKTATFLILGDLCTRGCSFCNVRKGKPEILDKEEPVRVAEAVRELKLEYAVITSVSRDDLPDGGAGIFAATIKSVRKLNPKCRIEVLIPDFKGDCDSLKKVLDSVPDVLNHNLETVQRLYKEVRKGADYDRSLKLFEYARSYNNDMLLKSGIMVGLGETYQEIEKSLTDLYNSGCELLTVGQYLAPSENHHPVMRYYTPDEFKQIKSSALKIGFKGVVSGPLIRSSYKAYDMFRQAGE